MSFTEVLPDVQSLSRADKIQLMEFLARDLNQAAERLIEPGKTYPIGWFHDQYSAAAELQKVLDEASGR